MLEYYAHTAVLSQLRSALKTTFAGDALLPKVDELCTAADLELDAATLGSMIDMMIDHAASDGIELQLLEQAADLWNRGLALYDQITTIRTSLETALTNPSAPSALQLANSALSSLGALRTSALSLNADAAALRAAIDPLPHIKSHPRQSDTPAKNWDWRDVFLGRRTEAFVEALFRAARSQRAEAFAFGVLGSYSGNISGSAYLGCVVGGPRRLHRYRDRLARNTVGAWLHGALASSSCGALARAIAFTAGGPTYALPSDIAAALEKAVAKAWPSRTAPDWNLGLARTVRHLELLDMFKRPDLPNPPPPEFSSGQDITGTLTFMSNDDYNVPTGTIDTGGNASATVGDTTVADSKSSSGDICLAILIILITVGIALLIYCIGQWTTGNDCDPADFFDTLQGSDAPDPRDPTAVNQQQLIALADPSAAGHVVQELFTLQMLVWQGFDAAAAFLAVAGLIYPDDLLMASPLYQQFLKTPVRGAWPFREEQNAINSYQFNPGPPVEEPTAADPPFPANETPLAFAGTWTPQQSHNPTGIAHQLLRNILSSTREEQNRDLDSDRGYRHPCWDIAAGTSIQDPVLSVEVLPYGAE